MGIQLGLRGNAVNDGHQLGKFGFQRLCGLRDGKLQPLIGCLDLAVEKIKLHPVQRRRIGKAHPPRIRTVAGEDSMRLAVGSRDRHLGDKAAAHAVDSLAGQGRNAAASGQEQGSQGKYCSHTFHFDHLKADFNVISMSCREPHLL